MPPSRGVAEPGSLRANAADLEGAAATLSAERADAWTGQPVNY